MTVTIDTTVFQNPILYIVVYVVGLIIAANFAAIYYRRHETCSLVGPEYVFGPIFWPVVALAWFLLLPSFTSRKLGVRIPPCLLDRMLLLLV